ncbi:MAG: hypothetical protein EHM21_10175 [Chloroflexi bacterium]|nr:MAG: hypothetical protein EHM21_10175 [Chloroflexota bacterium]
MQRENIWGFWIGVALVGLGTLFILGQVLSVNIMGLLWPFIIIGVGAAFFIGMVAGGRSMGALAVPGSVITTIGLILFFQNLFGLWSTWSYAWALIICGAGVGLMIFGNWSQVPEVRKAGKIVTGIGLVLFFVFGFFFQLGSLMFGGRSLGGIFWAVALILVGLYVLFGKAYFNQASGPVSRSMVNFSSQASVVNGADRVIAASDLQANLQADLQPGLEPIEIDPGPVEEAPASEVISGIRRLSFRSLGEITILQGEREGLEIEASEAMKERIRCEVRGNTLTIRLEQDWLDWLNPRFWNIGPIRYTLTARNLEAVDAAGLGNMLIDGIATRRLDLAHSGTGNVTVRRLEAEELSARQAGLGNIEVDGQVSRQTVDLTGTGSYHAQRLESRMASVRLSGLGSAVVRVSDTLDAQVSGTGSIEYFGNPRVSQRVSGLGSVRRLF